MPCRFQEIQVCEFSLCDIWGGLVAGLGGFDLFGEVAEVRVLSRGSYWRSEPLGQSEKPSALSQLNIGVIALHPMVRCKEENEALLK